jgi:excinuclease ABC subunit C
VSPIRGQQAELGIGEPASITHARERRRAGNPAADGQAKRKEEVFVPSSEEPLRLSRHSYALRLLQYVRDEAHRFAQHYHHILRRKTTLGE